MQTSWRILFLELPDSMTEKKISKSDQQLLKFHSYLRRFATFSARLPWWFGISCAAMTYLYFTFYFPQTALADPESPLLLRIVDDIVHRPSITKLFSGFFVGLFSLMTVFSSIKEFKRQGGLGGDDGTDALFVMRPKVFAAEVALTLTSEGYSITNVGKKRGGLDLVASKEDRVIGVRLSDFKQHTIHEAQIEQLVKCGKAEKCTGLIFITLGGYSKAARKLANKNGVRLLERHNVMAFMKREFDPFAPPVVAAEPERPAKGRGADHYGASGPSDETGKTVVIPRRVASAVFVPLDGARVNPNFKMPSAAISPTHEPED